MDNPVTAVSQQEYQAHTDQMLPAAEKVAHGVWTLPLRNRPGHMPYTFSYLLTDSAGDVHIVDPGWDLAENLSILRDSLDRAGARGHGPASIIVTHYHPDHMGMAATLHAHYGSPVVMHRREHAAQQALAERAQDPQQVHADLDAWGVPPERLEQIQHFVAGTPRLLVPADQPVDDGQLLPIPGRSVRVIHSPGHTPGHMCLHDEDQQLLFTGDHLLPKVTPGIGPAMTAAENPMEQYLHSLARSQSFDDCQSLPGHEYRFHGMALRAHHLATRHLGRTAEVAGVLDREPEATPWRVAEQLSWGRGWAGLDRHYLVSALRQTSMHMAMVRAETHRSAYTFWGHPMDGPKTSHSSR